MIDLTPLTRPLSAEEKADLRRRSQAGEFGPVGGMSAKTIIVVAIIAIGAVQVLGLATQFLAVSARMAASGGGLMPIVTVLSFPALMMVVIFFFAIRRYVRDRGSWQRRALLAVTNGLGFRRRDRDPAYPGLLFHLGDDRAALDHVLLPGRLRDVGTFTWNTGSGDNEKTHTRGFAAYQLDRALPHLVLDGAGRSLPVCLDESQRVSLGNPFDERFVAYAPEGYGSDTFQIFSPDVMSGLLRLSGTIDVEVVDGWLFVYAPVEMVEDPSWWSQLLELEQTTVERLATNPWVDRRVVTAPMPTPDAAWTVAPQGRELRQKTNWFLVILGALLVMGCLAFWLTFIGRWIVMGR